MKLTFPVYPALPARIRRMSKRRQVIACKRWVKKEINNALLKMLRASPVPYNQEGYATVENTVVGALAKFTTPVYSFTVEIKQ